MKKTLKDYEYIVGIDLGSQSTSVGYLNQSTLEPVVLDTSGGYKEGAIPTVMQYIPEEDSWLIGYNAKENLDMEEAVYLDHLLTYVEKRQTASVCGKTYTPGQLIAIYLRTLLENFRHINPNASIIGLVISISESGYEQLNACIDVLKQETGVDDLKVITDQQAIGRFLYKYHHLDSKNSKDNKNHLDDKVLHVLDYGYRAMKHYEVTRHPGTEDIQLIMKEVGYHDNIGCLRIEQMIRDLLIDRYRNHQQLEVIEPAVYMQIDGMLFQYYIWFFQKLREKKPLSIFYNFVYPPFKTKISVEDMEKSIAMMIDAYEEIVHPIIETGRFFLMGNGFRMPWTKVGIEAHENHDVILLGAVLEGCKAYVDMPDITISKISKSHYGYGIETHDGLFMLIEKGSACDMMYPPAALIIKHDIAKDRSIPIEIPIEIPIYKITEDGFKEVVERLEVEINDQSDGFIRVSVQLGLDGQGNLLVQHAVLPL